MRTHPPRRRLLTGVALLLSLTTCKRLDGDTLCEGTVVDRHTNARVPNATVSVMEAGQSGGLGGGYVLKEEHQADAQGNFAFQLADDGNDMTLMAHTSQGYHTRFMDAPKLRGGKNNKKIALKAQAPAWLRVRFRDQLPLDSGFITVAGSLEGGGFHSWAHPDTSIVYRAQANTNTLVYWQINVLHLGLRDGRQDVYTPGLDTTTVEVVY